MEEIISKEELGRLMKIKGKATGIPLRTDFDYILRKEGKEGVKRLEEVMAKLGFLIKHKEIKSTDLYPLGLLAVSLLCIQKLFSYDNKDFQEMGRAEFKSSSLIVRLFMEHLVSVKVAAQVIPKMWRKHYTVGEARITELNEEKRYGILKIKNFRLHPLHCQEFQGYFSSAVQIVVGSHVSCKETKCPFWGDEYHQFLVKW